MYNNNGSVFGRIHFNHTKISIMKKSKAKNALSVGKYFSTDSLGKVFVDSIVDGSFTLVNVTVEQRNKNWNENANAYVATKTVVLNDDGDGCSIHWNRSTIDQYGEKHVIHVNDLKPLKS